MSAILVVWYSPDLEIHFVSLSDPTLWACVHGAKVEEEVQMGSLVQVRQTLKQTCSKSSRAAASVLCKGFTLDLFGRLTHITYVHLYKFMNLQCQILFCETRMAAFYHLPPIYSKLEM